MNNPIEPKPVAMKRVELESGANEPTPMVKRPPVERITYISAEGNPHQFIVGRGGVTFIGETEENGEYCTIPWLEVWDGDTIVARFNQHKLEHILYRRSS